MVNVSIDISQIRNEITQIHNELHATYEMNDTQRRDAVNRLVERVRHLKSRMENTQPNIELK